MNNHQKWSALKLAVLLGTVSVLFTGCFIWRDNDHHDDQGHEDHHDDQDHHDQDHHDDQDHHE